MPSLNFQARFASAVESGSKLQTIRAARKHPIKVGDTLHLYTGMRTKACRKLARAICSRVRKITISAGGCIQIDGQWLVPVNTVIIAHRDGFESPAAMAVWFGETHGLPFEGDLIEWDAVSNASHQP